MRERFTSTVTDLLDSDERVALVTADIGVSNFVVSGAARRHPDRVINVGIREQLMIGVAAGLALEGFRPIAHSYTPFLIERPFEQVKLDLAHQDLGAILVSVGASYDASEVGRTHHSPGDVSLIGTLPDWDIYVPGHADEVEKILLGAASSDRRVYVRLAAAQNQHSIPDAVDGIVVVTPAPAGAPLVLAVGPMLDPVLDATRELHVAVAYTAAVQPLDTNTLRKMVGADVILIEPYLAGTSAHRVTEGLADRPIRLTSLGVGSRELRKYGSIADHDAAWGLDVAGLRRSIEAATERSTKPDS